MYFLIAIGVLLAVAIGIAIYVGKRLETSERHFGDGP